MTSTTTSINSPASPRALLDSALHLAARGWHVFPLRPDDKRPAFPRHAAADCDRRDPRCRDGHTGWEQRATTDAGRITRAWTSRDRDGRPYGIGVATGPSRLVVVDLDRPKPDQVAPTEWQAAGVQDGADVLAVVCERAGQPVPWDTHTVRTASGGTHLYFTAPTEGSELRNTTGTLGWLVDTRAAGGYVVAAPSTANGHPYTVIDSRDPAPLPAWLHQALAPAARASAPPRVSSPKSTGSPDRYLAAAVAGEIRRVSTAPTGQRNHTLFVASLALGQLVAGGALPETQATAALVDAVTGHVAAGAFTAAEALATIRSGLARGANEPRQLPASARDVA